MEHHYHRSFHISDFDQQSFEFALSVAVPLLAVMGAVSLAVEIISAGIR